MKILRLVESVREKITTYTQLKKYYKAYLSNSFNDGDCKNEKQYEASITRLYHTVEKGLAYIDYRAGFGKDNVQILVESMEHYSKEYNTDAFFYRTALCVLNEYVEKNKKYGISNPELEERINKLPGISNGKGGCIVFKQPTIEELEKMNFEKLLKNRHSIRHFSSEEVDIETVKNAIKLAQYTPSACNRQGWNARIVENPNKKQVILKNQNGNRGFGQEFDKIIVITGDLRYFNHSRELFQVYIDGGMYAMNIINSLYYNNIASVPLSAALTQDQEKEIRRALGIEEAEVFILIIGIGNYPKECCTTRSERKPGNVVVI